LLFYFGFLIWVDATQNIVVVFEQLINRSDFFIGSSVSIIVIGTFTMGITEFLVNSTMNVLAAM